MLWRGICLPELDEERFRGCETESFGAQLEI